MLVPREVDRVGTSQEKTVLSYGKMSGNLSLMTYDHLCVRCFLRRANDGFKICCKDTKCS